MERTKRPRSSAELRRAIMSRFGHSGLSVAGFCQRESISASSFYRWRSLLGDSSTREVVARGASHAATKATAFVELGQLQTSHAPLELRLELGGGVVLYLLRG